MEWRTVSRPGYFGKKRDQFRGQWNRQYGEGNWRIEWQWGARTVPFDAAVLLYEDGFYADSVRREPLWQSLVEVASDVYDIDPSDAESAFDYRVQKGPATHLQDIAVRRVVLRRGWEFEGPELVQVRSNADGIGRHFSPGRIPFHMPERIAEPRLEGWWLGGSVEDFWQSNKVLQVRQADVTREA